MAKERKARVGIAGLGGYSDAIAKAAGDVPDLEISSCFTRTESKMLDFQKKYGARPCRSYEEMLGSGIDAVILTTPNYVHAEQTEAAAAAGLHVFCEKPMANSIEHADRIIGACRRAGVMLAVGHQERRTGVFREMKRIIDSGEQGRPLYAEAHHGGRLKWPTDNWRWKKDLCPGPMAHLGVHKTDVLLYLFGPAKRVAAVGRRTLKKDIETNDIESAVIEFDSGVVASCTSSYIMQTASLNLYLEKATLWYGGYQSHLDVKNEETWEFSKLECPKVGTIADELKDFARAVLTGSRPEVGGEEGRSALALALAIERSAELGRAVLISEVAGAAAKRGA